MNLIEQGLAVQQAIVDANAAHLTRHENQEAVNAKREEDIERIAAESMLEGGEFYPFSRKNFEEAIRHMSDEEMGNLHSACEIGGWAFLDIGVRLRGLAKEYSKRCALVKARQHYKD